MTIFRVSCLPANHSWMNIPTYEHRYHIGVFLICNSASCVLLYIMSRNPYHLLRRILLSFYLTNSFLGKSAIFRVNILFWSEFFSKIAFMLPDNFAKRLKEKFCLFKISLSAPSNKKAQTNISYIPYVMGAPHSFVYNTSLHAVLQCNLSWSGQFALFMKLPWTSRLLLKIIVKLY